MAGEATMRFPGTDVPGMFTELEFEKSLDELDTPDVEGWELFVESQGVTIYRLYDEASGLYQYKTYGELEEVDPEVCADVYMDLEYRKKWDSYCKTLEVRNVDGKNYLSWELNFPFPLSNRDYVFGREFKIMEKDGRTVWIVLAKSVETPSLPERKGIVRVTGYMQSAVLCTNGKGGTKAFMRYFDNPGGSIPKWFINWAAKSGVPHFLTIMTKACKGYPEYKEDKKKEQSS